MREIFRQYFTKGFGFGAGFIAVLFTAGLLAVAVDSFLEQGLVALAIL
jgi:hypothetical protein